MTGEELKQQIALYESADHTVHLDVKVDEDTVWLNRQQLALLFGRDIKTIGKHVGNALREELNGFSVVAKFATTELSNSSFNALLICFPIVFTSLPNNSAIGIDYIEFSVSFSYRCHIIACSFPILFVPSSPQIHPDGF